MDIISEKKTPPKEIAAIALSIIGSIVCLIGGIFFIFSGLAKDANIAWGFATLGEVAFGVFTIIGALSALKYNFSGMFLCFIIGLFSLTISVVTDFYVVSLSGPLLTIIGSIIGLIGVSLTSPEQIKKFGICIIIIVIIYFLLWLYIMVPIRPL